MTKRTFNQKPDHLCFQCGSELIFVSEEIVQPEGTRFPQINTVYRCSNVACQEKKDKEKEDRLKQQQKKAEMAQVRLEEMQEKKKLNQQSKIAKD